MVAAMPSPSPQIPPPQRLPYPPDAGSELVPKVGYAPDVLSRQSGEGTLFELARDLQLSRSEGSCRFRRLLLQLAEEHDRQLTAAEELGARRCRGFSEGSEVEADLSPNSKAAGPAGGSRPAVAASYSGATAGGFTIVVVDEAAAFSAEPRRLISGSSLGGGGSLGGSGGGGGRLRAASSGSEAEEEVDAFGRLCSPGRPNYLSPDFCLGSGTSVLSSNDGKSRSRRGQGRPDFQMRGVWDYSIEDDSLDDGLGRQPSYTKYNMQTGADVTLFRNHDETKAVETSDGFLARFVSLPGSTARMVWDFCGASLIFYDLLTIPMNAFEVPETAVSKFMDWFTLIFWTVNMCMSPLVGFAENGITILVPRRTIQQYLKTWFLMDVCSLLPDWIFSLLALGEGTRNSAGSTVKLLRILRLVRMIRLIRLLKLGRILDDLNAMIDSEYISIVMKVVKMIVYLLLINHVIACMWFTAAHIKWDDEDHNNWLMANEMTGSSWRYLYLTSLHWSLTQFTPASMGVNPQNKVERSFAVMVVVFALVVFSYLLGSITGSLTQLRSLSEDMSKQFTNLRRYLRQQKVPGPLRFKLEKYLEHEWQRQKESISLKDVTIVGMLSDQLQGELQCALCVPHLSVHPLFKLLESVSPVTLFRLSNRAISRKMLAAGDSLFLPGENATHMYVVIAGRLRYVKQTLGESAAAAADAAESMAPVGSMETCDDQSGGAVLSVTEWVDSSEDWIAEPVLWTPTWKHMGHPISYLKSELLLVDAGRFAEVLGLNPQAMELTSVYARNFMAWLNEQDRQELSDITQGDQVGALIASFLAPRPSPRMSPRTERNLGGGKADNDLIYSHLIDAKATAPLAPQADWDGIDGSTDQERRAQC
mmetsp:Transcript_95991/g.311362  ORF Transcript_95991/g.311362 Transcript_95991/m.311362 type:complete len:874 (+) Transcript_95991:111-2732(+)